MTGKTDFIKLSIDINHEEALKCYNEELMLNTNDCIFRSFDLWLVDKEMEVLENRINS